MQLTLNVQHWSNARDDLTDTQRHFDILVQWSFLNNAILTWKYNCCIYLYEWSIMRSIFKYLLKSFSVGIANTLKNVNNPEFCTLFVHDSLCNACGWLVTVQMMCEFSGFRLTPAVGVWGCCHHRGQRWRPYGGAAGREAIRAIAPSVWLAFQDL